MNSWNGCVLVAIARGARSLEELLATCDYANHAIISYAELFEALNCARSRGLILGSQPPFEATAALAAPEFQQRSMSKAWDAAQALLERSPVVSALAAVELGEEQYDLALALYLQRMRG